MDLTAFTLAQRYIGIHEMAGDQDHPLIRWWLSLCGFPTAVHDEVPWCSAFVNGMAWELRLPRSKSAAARSWLNVGVPVSLTAAQVGWDVVILSRGQAPQGHVGFYAGQDNSGIQVLGGNQSDGVKLSVFKHADLLGIRRLT